MTSVPTSYHQTLLLNWLVCWQLHGQWSPSSILSQQEKNKPQTPTKLQPLFLQLLGLCSRWFWLLQDPTRISCSSFLWFNPIFCHGSNFFSILILLYLLVPFNSSFSSSLSILFPFLLLLSPSYSQTLPFFSTSGLLPPSLVFPKCHHFSSFLVFSLKTIHVCRWSLENPSSHLTGDSKESRRQIWDWNLTPSFNCYVTMNKWFNLLHRIKSI